MLALPAEPAHIVPSATPRREQASARRAILATVAAAHPQQTSPRRSSEKKISPDQNFPVKGDAHPACCRGALLATVNRRSRVRRGHDCNGVVDHPRPPKNWISAHAVLGHPPDRLLCPDRPPPSAPSNSAIAGPSTIAALLTVDKLKRVHPGVDIHRTTALRLLHQHGHTARDFGQGLRGRQARKCTRSSSPRARPPRRG